MLETTKTPEELLAMWLELRSEVEAADKDLHKSLDKSNAAAGRRMRSRCRALKKALSAFSRELVQLDKARVAAEPVKAE